MTRKRAIKLLMSIDGTGSRVGAQNLLKNEHFYGLTNSEKVRSIAINIVVCAFMYGDDSLSQRCVDVIRKAGARK